MKQSQCNLPDRFYFDGHDTIDIIIFCQGVVDDGDVDVIEDVVGLLFTVVGLRGRQK